MKKSAHFAKASTLRGSRTYVDQWKKVMVLVNANGIIALAIKEVNGLLYTAVASGDEYKKYIVCGKSGIGTMKKDMDTLFDMYYIFEGRCDLETIPNDSCGCPKQLYVWDYLPHTRMAVVKHGGFYESFDVDIASFIDKAEGIIGETNENFSTKKLYSMSFYEGSKVDYPDRIRRNGMIMYHVGDGMYCDDGGDNWDIY